MATRHIEIPIASFSTLGKMTYTAGDDGGGTALAAGDILVQGSAEMIVANVTTTSGAWADGDAAGTIYGMVRTRPTHTFSAGAATQSGGSASCTIATATNSGILDARFANCPIMASVQYEPAAAVTGPLILVGVSLCVCFEYNNEPTNLGFDLGAASDVLQIPLRVTHGPRPRGRDSQFFAFGVWDDSADDLFIFVGFQGIEGIGSDVLDQLQAAVMSADGVQDLYGDMVDLDLTNAKFYIGFSTDDAADPPSGGGGTVTVRSIIDFVGNSAPIIKYM